MIRSPGEFGGLSPGCAGTIPTTVGSKPGQNKGDGSHCLTWVGRFVRLSIMPRRARTIVGGYVFHVLNRANGRLRLFKKDADFAAFEHVLVEAHERLPLRILAYVLMSNHWHFVVWPKLGKPSDVSEFFRWLTVTHSQRWHAHHGTSGMGHVYQGRFKSFPVAADEHLRAVLRYVERNPVRAGLTTNAEEWRWSSLHRRVAGGLEERALLSAPPIPLGRNWINYVNDPDCEIELEAIRRSALRGRPYGSAPWQSKVTRQLGLEHTLRPRGRPRKTPIPEGAKEHSSTNDSRPL
jgi:putative transposase